MKASLAEVRQRLVGHAKYYGPGSSGHGKIHPLSFIYLFACSPTCQAFYQILVRSLFSHCVSHVLELYIYLPCGSFDLSRTKRQLTVSRLSFSFRLSVCLPACLLACLSACLSTCLPVCLSVRLPACLPACLSACLSGLPACLPVCQSVCMSACLLACLAVCLPE